MTTTSLNYLVLKKQGQKDRDITGFHSLSENSLMG